MKNIYTLIALCILTTGIFAQEFLLPPHFASSDLESIIFNEDNTIRGGMTDPPPFENLRAMAEWEEVQAITIAWTDYPCILKQIVEAAQLESVLIIILSEDVGETEDYLTGSACGGALTLDNVTIIDANFDSIWIRDYAGNPVYGNEVDSLIMVDWVYNRPRPNDDASPELVAEFLNLPFYSTTESPNDLMNTGGNFMTDGFGTAFASELVLQENDGDGNYNIDYPTHSEEEIDILIDEFMGIDRYIKMETLPYDGIHHIDMHMKLLDEETIIAGQFPEDVADGPQIEANIEYVLSDFNSKWGTPYKIIWVPMPPSTSGLYADDDAAYRTYTNAVFVNETLIVPYYREEYDTVAYNILSKALPGYNIVGIDCDNNSEPIIFSSGAVHCITHAIGVEDPLLISHQPLPDTDDTVNPYEAVAYIAHRDGVSNATLWWKTTLGGTYSSIDMNNIGNNDWSALIPAKAEGTTVYYYIHAQATTGKEQVRPMPAPEGYWKFIVGGEIVGVKEAIEIFSFNRVFPNPAGNITCVDINSAHATDAKIQLVDMFGKTMLEIFNGELRKGQNKFFFEAEPLAAGAYRLVIQNERSTVSELMMVK
ncbi:MAG: agmatine deiminase family protein [Flavobacteriales bacterium]|nr:agmatine deiminase family protein [Flavobacteriales bacterium]